MENHISIDELEVFQETSILVNIIALWCHPTWLAGKSPLNGVVHPKLIENWSIFQHAMFDYRKVIMMNEMMVKIGVIQVHSGSLAVCC